MSEKKMEEMIKEFLKQVKNKLPDWLKDKTREVKDIMDELEEHIWSKAEELSGIGYPTEDSIRMAIAHMGTPESIAKEYKRRGTPKIYITEELWPLYKKVLITIVLIILALNVISVVFDVIEGNIVGALNNLFNFYGILGAAAIITIIFVALSMEGYLPEDFKSKRELIKEKRELEIAREKGLPISTETGKPLKPFIKPGGEIIGGILGIGFGILLLIFPFAFIEDILNPQFILLLRILGLISVFEGSCNLSRGLLGNNQPQTHQKLLTITLILKFVALGVIIVMFTQPSMNPLFYWNVIPNVQVNVEFPFQDTYRIIFAVFVIMTILGIIEDIYKIVKLERYKQ